MHSDDDNDIARLYAQFGGDPAGYQEIATLAAASQARARWPMLAAFDPLQPVAAPAVGVDDGAVMAQAAQRAADAQGAAAEPVRPQPQFIAPSPKPFNRDVPRAFLVPQPPEPAPASHVADPVVPPAAAFSAASAAVPSAAPSAPSFTATPAAIAAPAGGPVAAPAAEAAANEQMAAPAGLPGASGDPFRRLVADSPSEPASGRLPDLFKRLLSS
ncbi:hypothetical protein CAL26_27360 [Bordetella genomosp. 9]|uniref:Cellulose biosynthesis protein BcsR n=1 Tax=Bordetella genomosp. 9 TaxID=1416803 RepID=A0A261R9V7_9BORD|nr:cellulose biosynthesis protein BcsP [Bordetella genomosp. 9]OZI21153.1 hypothetical protein CAL26_27360 [Bordetella genomosp. 9]